MTGDHFSCEHFDAVNSLHVQTWCAGARFNLGKCSIAVETAKQATDEPFISGATLRCFNGSKNNG
jgi:hypothetical protein